MQSLTGIIDRFERRGAVVLFDNKQTLIIPKRYLPKKCAEGSVIHFDTYLAEDATRRRENIGRYLLEEILQPHDQRPERPNRNN